MGVNFRMLNSNEALLDLFSPHPTHVDFAPLLAFIRTAVCRLQLGPGLHFAHRDPAKCPPLLPGRGLTFLLPRGSFFFPAIRFFSRSWPHVATGAGLHQGCPDVSSYPIAKSPSGTPGSFRALLFGFVPGPVFSAAQTHPALLPDASIASPQCTQGMTR